mgnify:CR=1 FL=1
MENIWDDNDLYNAQYLVQDLVNIYVKLLSDFIELPEKDTLHLANEMTYMSTSILVDTSYRLKKKMGDRQTESIQDKISVDDLIINFFEHKVGDLHESHSRIMRCRLSNLLALAQGLPPIFEGISQESQKITIEDAGVTVSPSQWRFLAKYFVRRIPEIVFNYLKVACNLLR